MTDHVVPRIIDGSDALANLQLLCSKCNSAKSDYTLDFRDPDWGQYEAEWSGPEAAVRQHLVRQGRMMAMHRDFPLAQPTRMYIELWECWGCSKEQVNEALQQVEGSEETHAAIILAAHAVLGGKIEVVRGRVAKARQEAAAARAREEAAQAKLHAAPRPPRRVKTRLGAVKRMRQRLGRR